MLSNTIISSFKNTPVQGYLRLFVFSNPPVKMNHYCTIHYLFIVHYNLTILVWKTNIGMMIILGKNCIIRKVFYLPENIDSEFQALLSFNSASIKMESDKNYFSYLVANISNLGSWSTSSSGSSSSGLRPLLWLKYKKLIGCLLASCTSNYALQRVLY